MLLIMTCLYIISFGVVILLQQKKIKRLEKRIYHLLSVGERQRKIIKDLYVSSSKLESQL